eukprot:IDg22813t1
MDTANHTVVEIDEEIPCLSAGENDDHEVDMVDYLLISS